MEVNGSANKDFGYILNYFGGLLFWILCISSASDKLSSWTIAMRLTRTPI